MSHAAYGKRPRVRGGSPTVVAPNLLSQQFTVNAPNKVWVTDITHINTHEGLGKVQAMRIAKAATRVAAADGDELHAGEQSFWLPLPP